MPLGSGCLNVVILQNDLTSRATVVDCSDRQNGATTPMPKPVSLSEPKLKTDVRPGKIPLEKGYSQMDWMRLTKSHPDLAGLAGKSRNRAISMAEVKQHRSKDDAWLVLKGKVYNVTPYLKFHPGGLDWIMKGAGLDATSLFNKYHAWVNAEFMLEKCVVGYLVVSTPAPQQS
ncbi:hypothetical protein ABBQ32_004152 [Trebouxia sp. C0010 RCD-2024]